MARRQREEEKDNHERWLVSYADFITLLFAFFVVMYALSSVNEGKYRILSNSMVSAFRNVPVNSSGTAPMVVPTSAPAVPKVNLTSKTQDAVRQQQREKMRHVAKEILEVMAPLVEQGKVRVLETSRGVSIEINDSILFSPGQALLQPPLAKAMQSVAEVLVASDFPITIEGHTDDLPIKNTQFPSNWELSAVRATTVLRLFADAGVAAARLTAIGYADTRPVEPNVLADGRARNRRVTILIDSEIPEKGTEVNLQGQAAQLKPATTVPAEALPPSSR
ncbi:MAG: flagellar motor protein MotD [Candidatus Accumulibacter sp.]|jgi:chemotaxis protein MotB|uniref:flagellar motor protein MotD n=1 Tax=Accumulibacter sp. TaxID=2053492 RepID=UPI001ACF09DD|nr:flagellar motor protein MotD [Accumulibacter sp.]MBK8114079.1 flagellar motor protein MotD [Accumulibacter sp.]MBK8384436.1 flagellar motor protein MotD [Accumulibacter sp.]MBK8577263.1 flagellar motor protein MotD [Candidatus Accumulibacter propinquus]MBN8438435.1 flagellar motor protein MotD [Accumulibacter sp.]